MYQYACELRYDHDGDHRQGGFVWERLAPGGAAESDLPVERDLWWGYLCPALASINALKSAQRDLVAIGVDSGQAGRILSHVQSFYVDSAHEASKRYVAEQVSPPARPVCDCAPDCAERIACPEIGTLGHMGCGWCEEHDQARHICLCQPSTRPAITSTKKEIQ